MIVDKMSKAYIKTLCERGQTALISRRLSTATNTRQEVTLELMGKKYPTDNWTNITPSIRSKLGKNLHVTSSHPLSLLRQRIINYFHQNFCNRISNPIFSVYDNINPIVTTQENFDSLLVPKNHPSRNKTDCYYVNEKIVLRSHTTAHQAQLISMGLDNFLIIGDVYRRDQIDSTHYPVFHQVDGVRLCTKDEVFKNVQDSSNLAVFEQNGVETDERQGCHTLEAVKIMEHELKNTLIGMTKTIFGNDIKYQWNKEYFPFTYPSWELEIYHNKKWIEILGCGIMRQQIIDKSGAKDHIGWAFGLGLERLAMCLYDIPDIRLFWSNDEGFLNQFIVDDINTNIQYKPVSVYPSCKMDVSFWLPKNGNCCSNDFYDIVRDVGGDLIEQIILLDKFVHPETKLSSHCYTIVYRHMERNLTREEVKMVHNKIQEEITNRLQVLVRK